MDTNSGKSSTFVEVPEVILFTKPQCPLCNKAAEEMENAREIVEFRITEANIYADQSLFEKYRYEIPVAVCRGEEIFRHRTTAREFAEKLLKILGKTESRPKDII